MLKKLLQTTFNYDTIPQFGSSVMPSIKYGATGFLGVLSIIVAFVEDKLGIGQNAIYALFIVMIFDLISGLVASKVKGDKITSVKWARFSLKVGLWFIIIYVTHEMAEDFRDRNLDAIATTIGWIHTVLLLHIFFEYLISVLENLSIISGRQNDSLIEKIKSKIKNLFD